MTDALTTAHITAQQRLRALAARGVAAVWSSLPAHNSENLDEWLTRVLPLIAAAQRQSALITDAYLARAIERPPIGLDLAQVTGASTRNGTPPEDVYKRPFITVWTAIGNGKTVADASAQGLARATATAETDVQLAMRETLRYVGLADTRIVGYQRVPDAGACKFCRTVAGQRYRVEQLMPIHPNCGCGVKVITADQRPAFTGNPENDLNITRDGVHAVVREHGELGPVLLDGNQHFEPLHQ